MIGTIWIGALIASLTLLGVMSAAFGGIGLTDDDAKGRTLAWAFIAAAILCEAAAITLAASIAFPAQQQENCT
jgi:hypothetical protein